jgi:A/G-specific adenine glycosylase
MDARALRRRLLTWFDRHGRKDLPWQRSRDPYRVWVSEIMLQQTQVSTVIPYYERFLKRFPDVGALARARLDSVLHHWTGLGYYARARNLKKAAEVIVREHGGRFPREIEAVAELPGIGRSTAGAILAFAFGQRHPILDGNVKRVLTRLHAIATPINERNTEQQLWQLAEEYTPKSRVADYTQAIMDLGATVCRPRRPDCTSCPLRNDCRAAAAGRPEDYPVRSARKALPMRQTVMLMIRDRRGRVLLTQRPPTGLWGGLWGFPECSSTATAVRFGRDQLGIAIEPAAPWPALRHGFSHFTLDITPLPATLKGTAAALRETAATTWVDPRRPDARGLAAPVKRLLQKLRD